MPSIESFAEELKIVAQRCREVSEDGLRRELLKAASDATKPVIRDIKSGLADYLPNRYAAVLGSDLKLQTSKRLMSKANFGVFIKAKTPGRERQIATINSGTLRHTLFGDRKRWYAQDVKSGFFSDPIIRSQDEIRERIYEAMERVAEQVIT